MILNASTFDLYCWEPPRFLLNIRLFSWCCFRYLKKKQPKSIHFKLLPFFIWGVSSESFTHNFSFTWQLQGIFPTKRMKKGRRGAVDDICYLCPCTVHRRHPHSKVWEYFIGFALYPEEEEVSSIYLKLYVLCVWKALDPLFFLSLCTGNIKEER